MSPAPRDRGAAPLRRVRWLDSGPLPAALNMAIDQVLLEGALDRPTLRVYAWASPALTLGRFQDRSAIPPALAGLVVVRRASGGGAILHRDELTYSAALPADWVEPARVRGRVVESYRRLHEAVRDALASFGARADDHDIPAPRPSVAEPFLCYARRSGFDLTIGGRKLVGSAQRRSGGALLQHGSVPLGLEPPCTHLAAPGATTLRAEAGRAVTYPELARALAGAFARRLGLALEPAPLTEREEERAALLAAGAFAALEAG